MDEFSYVLAVVATVTFSVTGVLATSEQRIDIVGVVVVGIVTAVGGGTVRDIILDVPVFWIEDGSYLVAAVVAAVMTFILRDRIHSRYQWLLYLDALGVALFASSGVVKTLALDLNSAHAMVMGVITGIGGGLIRDLLTARPTLVMSRDLYATPILLGISVQLILMSVDGVGVHLATLTGGAVIFLGRCAAIRFHLRMPDFLVFNARD